MSGDAAGVLAWEFPNPISWTVDKISGFVGGLASAGFEMVIGGLVAWVTDAVVWIVGGVFNFFIDAEDPNVQADWFIGTGSPYETTAAIGATLMVGFLLAGIAQGAIQGDVGGMLRRMAADLPASVLGIVGLVTVTQALIRLTDELSTRVMSGFQDDIADFTAVVLSLSRLSGGVASALVIFLLGFFTVMAGLVLIAELAVRAALVYIVVALAPLVFAAQLWPALKGTGQKLLRLICGLVVAKLAMAVALAVAAAAAVGTGSGGEVTTLPEPEVFAEDPGGSVTQAVGILLAAAVAFGVAAYMPFLVARLLPLAEEAAVAQGLRSAPLRAAQQGLSFLYHSQTLSRLSSGWPGGSSGPAGRGPRGPRSGGRGPENGPGSQGSGRGPSSRGPRPGGPGPGAPRSGAGRQQNGGPGKATSTRRRAGPGGRPAGGGTGAAGKAGAVSPAGAGVAVAGAATAAARRAGRAGRQAADSVGRRAGEAVSQASSAGSSTSQGPGRGVRSGPAASDRSQRAQPPAPRRRPPSGGAGGEG